MEVLIGKDFINNKNLDPNNDLVLLYFSAHWCPPWKKFNKKLCEIYEDTKELRNNVEVIYISLDYNKEDFEMMKENMPWLVIPYEKEQRRKRIVQHCRVTQVPSFVLVDKNAQVVIRNCRRDLMKLGRNSMKYWAEFYMKRTIEA